MNLQQLKDWYKMAEDWADDLLVTIVGWPVTSAVVAIAGACVVYTLFALTA